MSRNCNSVSIPSYTVTSTPRHSSGGNFVEDSMQGGECVLYGQTSMESATGFWDMAARQYSIAAQVWDVLLCEAYVCNVFRNQRPEWSLSRVRSGLSGHFAVGNIIWL
jgi:hypothetical protein